MYILQSSSTHLVSAADSEMNNVGMPNCWIIAINSFFLCSKYGGLDQIFLNMQYPSSYFTMFCLCSLLSSASAVIVLPLV